MRTPSLSKTHRTRVIASLAAAQVLFFAANVRAQAPVPSNPPAQDSNPVKPDRSSASPPPSPGDAWVFGLPVTRVGDARPWLGETAESRWWINPEYLLWWVRDEHTPGPLVTTGDPNSPTAGVPGDPTTSILFGGKDVRFGIQNGGRLSWGYQSADLPISFEGSFFALENKGIHFRAQSDAMGSPLIAIPVNLFGTGLTAVDVSNPGNFSGGVRIDVANSLWGGEANCVHAAYVDDHQACSWLVGLRCLELDESFKLATSSTDLATGSTFSAFDSFGTRNHFFGVQFGAEYTCRQDRLCLTAFNKVGIGCTDAQINISGMRTGALNQCDCLTAAGFLATPSAVSGILTSPSNVGSFSSDRFSVIDEIGINSSFELCDHVAATAGFSFLFWSDVARPGNQINTIVAPAGVTPPATAVFPGPLNRRSDFWAYGFNFGLEFRR